MWGCVPSQQSPYLSLIPSDEEYVKIKVKKSGDLTNMERKSYSGIDDPIAIIDSNNDRTNQTLQNPFSPSTLVEFINEGLPDSFLVSLVNVKGNTIKTPNKIYFDKGSYVITFDELHVNSGVYFVSVNSKIIKWQKKIILVR